MRDMLRPLPPGEWQRLLEACGATAHARLFSPSPLAWPTERGAAQLCDARSGHAKHFMEEVFAETHAQKPHGLRRESRVPRFKWRDAAALTALTVGEAAVEFPDDRPPRAPGLLA